MLGKPALPFLAVMLVLSGCAGNSPKDASSSDPAPPPSAVAPIADETKPCIEGYVLDDELTPIPFATVALGDFDNVRQTDEAGYFQFCDLEPISYPVFAEALGYLGTQRRVQAPSPEGGITLVLKPIPILEPYTEMVPRVIFYTYGYSTLDTTTSRFVPNNQTNCNPCSFTFATTRLPDIVLWELQWTRTFRPISFEDQMYHIFRGGAPFENAPGDTSVARDIGTGTHGQPWSHVHNRTALLKAPPIKEAFAKNATEYPFSGSVYCWGSPPVPCASQRINVYLTLFYDYLEVPQNFTALPDS